MADGPAFSGPLVDALERLNGLLADQGVAVSLTVDTQAFRRGESHFVSAAELVPVAAAPARGVKPLDEHRW